MKNILRCLALLVVPFLFVGGLFADEKLGPITLKDTGSLAIGDITANIIYFGDGYKIGAGQMDARTSVALDGYPKIEGNKYTFEGKFQNSLMSCGFAINETITQDGKSYKYECSMIPEDNIETDSLHIEFLLPVKKFKDKTVVVNDSEEISFPADFSESRLFAPKEVETVVIPLPGGKKLKISGNIKVYMQDSRQWKSDNYAVRIFFNPDKGTLQKNEPSNLSFNLEVK